MDRLAEHHCNEPHLQWPILSYPRATDAPQPKEILIRTRLAMAFVI
jgi:hypothetical protein